MHKPANTYMFNTSPQLLPRLSPREIKDNAHRFETRVRNLNCSRCKTIFGVAQINVRDIFLLHVQGFAKALRFAKAILVKASVYSVVSLPYSSVCLRIPATSISSAVPYCYLKKSPFDPLHISVYEEIVTVMHALFRNLQFSPLSFSSLRK